MRTRLAVASILVCALGVLRPPTAAPGQTARDRRQPATIDFFAVGKDGRPVPDLKPEEVQVRIDGRPRAIQSLRFVASGAAPAAAPLPPPFGANTGAGRAFYVVVEDGSIRPGTEPALKAAIGEFLNGLSASDRVGLVTVPHPLVSADPSAPRGAIRDAVSRIAGRALGTESPTDAICRTRETLDALKGLMTRFGDDAPTIILFVSGSLVPATAEGTRIGSDTRGCVLSTNYYYDLARAAGAVRAYFYVVQADEVITPPDEGLESLAGVTSGGRVLRLAPAEENPLGRVARETSGSYRLAIQPESSDRAGQSRRLELRASRADVAIRAQPEITMAGPGRTATPGDMLRVATPYRDLPLRVAGYASRPLAAELKDHKGDGGAVKIVALAEPIDPAVKLTAAAAALYDAKGTVTAQWILTKEELAASPVTAGLIAAPGTYRLRFAATDAAGRSGTADYEVDAALVPAGPARLSALLLGTSSGNGFRPALAFGGDPEVVGYFELYGAPDALRLTSAPRLELAAAIDGAPIAAADAAVSTTSEPDRFILTAALPIASLAPGDYIVRAVLDVEGQPPVRVVRTLRKVAR
jgi:hypothetical protein